MVGQALHGEIVTPARRQAEGNLTVLKTTVLAITFREAWHAFMVRKTITMTWELGFVHGNLATWFPPLRRIVGSLLYVELATLLDHGCETQMTKSQSKKCHSLNGRISFLADQSKVLDPEALHKIRKRRDRIAHDYEQGVELAELDEAIVAVRTQAAAWGLIGEPWPNYEAFARRTRVKSDNPEYAIMLQETVGVNRDGQSVYQVMWNQYMGRIGSYEGKGPSQGEERKA